MNIQYIKLYNLANTMCVSVISWSTFHNLHFNRWVIKTFTGHSHQLCITIGILRYKPSQRLMNWSDICNLICNNWSMLMESSSSSCFLHIFSTRVYHYGKHTMLCYTRLAKQYQNASIFLTNQSFALKGFCHVKCNSKLNKKFSMI
jgi:hypothetical protein